MLNRLVRARELSEVVASHFRFNFNRVEDLSVVDTNDRSNHLRYDDHVTEVGLDNSGLFIWWGSLLGLAQLLDKSHRALLETTLEPTASTGVDEL